MSATFAPEDIFMNIYIYQGIFFSFLSIAQLDNNMGVISSSPIWGENFLVCVFLCVILVSRSKNIQQQRKNYSKKENRKIDDPPGSRIQSSNNTDVIGSSPLQGDNFFYYVCVFVCNTSLPF